MDGSIQPALLQRRGRARDLPMRLLILLFALICCAQDWPQFRGNPQLTGVTTNVLPKTLKLLWTYEHGESIESSAAIADGGVYVGSQSGDLLAIDLSTGKLRWKYHATKNGIG